MMKCPQDKVDSATHRATVSVCPKYGRILDAEELLRLLKRLGFSERLVKQVRREIRIRNFVKEL